MATLQIISDQFVQDSIIRAVQNVCATMLKRTAGFLEKSPESAYAGFNEKPYVFGSVGFVGQINGIVYFCIPEDFAREASAQLLGLTDAELERSGPDAIKDVIGEITNMTVGNFKTALCDSGFPCRLTPPTIVRGERLAVSALKHAKRHLFHFDCAGHRLVADIQVKQE